MDTLHGVLRTIRTETKSDKTHLDVFREFLAHLEHLQRRPQPSAPRPKAQTPRKSARRVRAS